MEAVTVWDTKDAGSGHRTLSFDLVDILKLVEPELPGSEWQLEKVVEAVGEASRDFDRLCETSEPIQGPELLALASRVDQIVDGDFRGIRFGELWLRIRAIDSTEYVVITNDESILSRIRGRFSDVRESPEDARWYGA